MSLESASLNSEVLNAMKSGAKSLKIDNIEDQMDDIREQMGNFLLLL